MPKRKLSNDKDVVVSMFIELKVTDAEELEEHYRQISYALNRCCSELEDLKCNAFYRMKDSLTGQLIEVEDM